MGFTISGHSYVQERTSIPIFSDMAFKMKDVPGVWRLLKSGERWKPVFSKAGVHLQDRGE